MTESFKALLGQTTAPEVIDQFIQILELPDEKFNAIFPTLKRNITESYNSDAVKNNIVEAIKQNPNTDLKQEAAAMTLIKQEINDDESLSPLKKELIFTIIDESINATLEVAQNPREVVTVKVEKISDVNLPEYAHASDAGADIMAAETITIPAGETKIVKTGLKVAVPIGYMLNIYPRSGISLKTPLRVANSVGVIDSLYRGEIGVIMTNIGTSDYTIEAGTKIAQAIIMPAPMIQWEEVEQLDSTERGEGGFGSTDTKS